MITQLPSVEDVSVALATLTMAQIKALAAMTGVSERGLLKIRYGDTTNPGLATVRAFLPHIKAARRSA